MDTNDDGEIQVSEALVVEKLDLRNNVPGSDKYFTDITGIEYFKNLKFLNVKPYLGSNLIFDVSKNQKLEKLMVTINIADKDKYPEQDIIIKVGANPRIFLKMKN